MAPTAILRDGTLYYGQSGDSGIIALAENGAYVKVTEKQNDRDGCVYPLCFGDHWVFDKYPGKVAGVLLATDGIFDTFFPVYIRDRKIKIHVSLVQYFLDPEKLRFNLRTEEEISAARAAYLLKIPEKTVGDDKTVAVLLDPEIPVGRMPDAYYAEPDWDKLRQAFRARYEAGFRRAEAPKISEKKELSRRHFRRLMAVLKRKKAFARSGREK